MSNRLASGPISADAPRPLPAGRGQKARLSRLLTPRSWPARSLAALDACVRANAAFAGLWRNRLALRAAVAHARLLGRREGESELRDGLALACPAMRRPARPAAC